MLYEICNEPNGVPWKTVKSYADRVIAAIRAIDREKVILVGTPTWSQDIHHARANPVSKPENVMYAFHFYAGTHMPLVKRVREEAKLIPIFATEWGTSQANGDGGPYLEAASNGARRKNSRNGVLACCSHLATSRAAWPVWAGEERGPL